MDDQFLETVKTLKPYLPFNPSTRYTTTITPQLQPNWCDLVATTNGFLISPPGTLRVIPPWRGNTLNCEIGITVTYNRYGSYA